MSKRNTYSSTGALSGEELYYRIETLVHRKDRTMNMGRLCESFGMSRCVLSNLKRNKNVSISQKLLYNLSTYLGVSPEKILYADAGEKSRHPEFIKLTGSFMTDVPTADLTNAKPFYLRKDTICMIIDNQHQPNTAIVYTATDQFLVEGTAEEILELL